MKKTLIVFILLLFSVSTYAQNSKAKKTAAPAKPAAPAKKNPTDSSKTAKPSAVSQQVSALVDKAIADTISKLKLAPKTTPSKTTYGILTLTLKVPIYDVKNKDTLPNPSLAQMIAEAKAKAKTSKKKAKVETKLNGANSELPDSAKYAYLTIDSVQVNILKNDVIWVHVYTPNSPVLQNDTVNDLQKFQPKNIFHINIPHLTGVIRLTDFLSFLLYTPINDNIKSGIITLSKGTPKASITSY